MLQVSQDFFAKLPIRPIDWGPEQPKEQPEQYLVTPGLLCDVNTDQTVISAHS